MYSNDFVKIISSHPVVSVPRGALPSDEREHEPARAVVVPGPDLHPHGHGRLADETPQELLRGQEARMTNGHRRACSSAS